MIIPPTLIDKDTLTNILEEFITREGTDYGEQELSLNQKIARLRPQIMDGTVLLFYSEEFATIRLINKQDYNFDRIP
jgi:uncharacterized protein YheU (UPF0270 family)